MLAMFAVCCVLIFFVDFIEMRLREGMPLAEAVVDAGAIRFRPMALTAAAVIVGSAVILFDPIFQGLAICLTTFKGLAGNGVFAHWGIGTVFICVTAKVTRWAWKE